MPLGANHAQRRALIGMSMLIVVVTGSACLLSLDGLSGGPDPSLDAGLDAGPPVGDTGLAHDAMNTADSEAGDVPLACGDASTEKSATCRAFGVCCPQEAPFCRLMQDYPRGTLTLSCVPAPGGAGRGDLCDPPKGECADGLSCGVTYPHVAPYACVPLCRTSGDCACAGGACPDQALACTTRLTATSSQKQCSSCDPLASAVANPCDAGHCTVTAAALGPSCHDGSLGLGSHSCANGNTDYCAVGLGCVCDAGVGNDCQNIGGGVCRRLCAPYEVGSACALDGTCTAVPGTDYAYCKP